VLSLPTGGDTPRIQVARSFTEPQWRFLLRHVSDLPADDPRAARLTFMLHLAHASGLRISEQAAATVGHLTWNGHWTLAVPGPKPRQIPLPEAVIDALRGHLAARGLGRGFESLPAATPLIGRVKIGDEGGALSVAQIGAIWKRYFAQAATLAGAEDDAAQLAQASAHWMRHTAGAHAVARGVALEVVQQQLGHASLDTTSMYVLAA
jgi:integrase